MRVAWRIYYDAGSTCDSADGAPTPHGVIAIVQRDEQAGRVILSGYDYYILLDQWYGADRDGVMDHVLNKLYGLNMVVAGRTIETDRYQAIYQRALRDYDFPPKSAASLLERPQHNKGRTE